MTLERWQQQALAAGILLGLALIAWFAVINPIAGAFQDQRERQDRASRLLASYQAELAARPQLEAQLDRLKEGQSATSRLVQGQNADLAAANMQSLVKALVAQETGQIRTAQNLDPQSNDGLERIAIQYEISLPAARLENTIYRVETDSPNLFLDDVDNRMPESWQTEGAAGDPPPVEVRWTVRGYRNMGSP